MARPYVLDQGQQANAAVNGVKGHDGVPVTHAGQRDTGVGCMGGRRHGASHQSSRPTVEPIKLLQWREAHELIMVEHLRKGIARGRKGASEGGEV